ncbi:response regulator transcription factor [Kibdelosporangium lantanae]|uniref:Response regulator transcription factor n=1 Tax=Kibdelosporangium lantanae TaxID=1497396 RepID=A0ABW3M6L1_9PSEU
MVLRIIVADDQASVREGLAIMLDLLPDITVVAQAANGREALDMVEEHAPDAILLDLHMPVLDGTETTRRLIREHPEVAVVILTTYADDTNVLETLKAGARAYITKDTDRAGQSPPPGRVSPLRGQGVACIPAKFFAMHRSGSPTAPYRRCPGRTEAHNRP